MPAILRISTRIWSRAEAHLACSSLDGPRCAPARAAYQALGRRAGEGHGEDHPPSEGRRRGSGRAAGGSEHLRRFIETDAPLTIYLDAGDGETADAFASWSSSVEALLENAVNLDAREAGVLGALEELGLDAAAIGRLVDAATELVMSPDNDLSLRSLEEVILRGAEEEEGHAHGAERGGADEEGRGRAARREGADADPGEEDAGRVRVQEM